MEIEQTPFNYLIKNIFGGMEDEYIQRRHKAFYMLPIKASIQKKNKEISGAISLLKFVQYISFPNFFFVVLATMPNLTRP